MDSELGNVIDLTAMILCNLKNSPSSSPSSTPPPSSPISSPRQEDTCDCMLCERGSPVILSKCHTWAWIMRVVFYALRERFPEKMFFSLKNDVYEYIINHWNILGLDKKPSANWHKQIQDMLSHSRNIFESGMNHYRQNGFWRLKDLEDPWTSRPDAPRLSPPDSPRKRTLYKKDTPSPVPAALNESSDDDSTVPSSKKRCVTPPSDQSAPSSPTTSFVPIPTKLDQEVALLREQLAHMTESMANLSAPFSPQPSYHHNRVWEESFTNYASVNA